MPGKKFGMESAGYNDFQGYKEFYGLNQANEGEKIFCSVSLDLFEVFPKEQMEKIRKNWVKIFLQTYSTEGQDPRDFLFAVVYGNKEVVEKLYASEFLDKDTYEVLCEAIENEDRDEIYTEAKMEVDVTIYNFSDLEKKKKGSGKKYVESKIARIDDDTLLLMSKAYRDFIEARQKEFRERVETLRMKAVGLIQEFLKEKYFFEIPEGKMSFLQSIPIFLADPVVSQFGEEYGAFSPREEWIRVRLDLSADTFFSVLVHELLHALAGKIILRYTSENSNEDSGFLTDEYVNIKTGISVVRHDPLSTRLVWLDEAITERLSLHIVESRNGSYIHDRKILDFLLTRVDEKYFVEAYLEEYDENLPSPERLDKMRTLIQKINEAFGPFFLQRLEKYIQKHGVAKTAQLFKTENWEAEINH